VVDGIVEAASQLELITLTSDERAPSKSVVLRPTDSKMTSQILLAASADRSVWSDELREFWHAAESLIRVQTRRVT
jgi:hypothetical protein